MKQSNSRGIVEYGLEYLTRTAGYNAKVFYKPVVEIPLLLKPLGKSLPPVKVVFE